MNRGLVVSVILALVATSLPLAASAANDESASLVEIHISNLVTKQPLTGTASFRWDNQTEEIPLALAAHAEVRLSQTFSDVARDGEQEVTLRNDAGVVVLHALTRTSGDELAFASGDINSTALQINPSESSIRVITGTVEGTLNARVVFTESGAAAAASVTLGVDGNGDDTVTADEEAVVRLNGTVAEAEIRVDGAPPLTKWRVAVARSGSLVLDLHGEVDWVSGSAGIDTDRLDPAVWETIHSITLTPHRTSLSGEMAVPNVLLAKTVAAQDGSSQAQSVKVTIEYGDDDPNKASMQSTETGESKADPGLKPFAPVLGFAAIVLLGAVVLIAGLGVVTRRKRGGEAVVVEQL